MNLANHKVSILGAGKSGVAAAMLAVAQGASVTIYDVNESASFPEGFSGVAGVTLEQAAEIKSDLVVVSPGIDTCGSFVEAFSTQAGSVIGEMELASRYYDGRIIAITGTNGKTTTTELIHAFITAAGYSCVPCGNYGTPLSEVVLMDSVPDYVALEVSSFQLETIIDFHPTVALWMNFAADHMDRYPDLESYRRAKLRIFENQTQQDLAIIRAGESIEDLAAVVKTFSSVTKADVTLERNTILDGDKAVLDMAKSRLRGSHNAENVMAAYMCANSFGISSSLMQTALISYQPPSHRCEFIDKIDSVEYVNDSKATNFHALESALSSQSRPIVLIVGGKEKGLDYSGLPALLKQYAVAVVCFGEIREQLRNLISDTVRLCSVETLDEAVIRAAEYAPRDSMVLFSPGTSSFDQFSGYEERGDSFREAVQRLKHTT